MDKISFIDYIGKIAQKDWKERRICVPSVVIAQAMKESACGTSELAVAANALFGIKKNGWTGATYHKVATEQRPDGSYYTTQDPIEWRAYENWEQSIMDHNTYIATRKVGNQTQPNWIKVVGESDYKKAIHEMQNAQYRYATSLTYEESIIRDYIEKYELYKYDEEVEKRMKILLISGHGAGDSGAIATINGKKYIEAEETAKLTELIWDGLRAYADVDVYPVERNAYADVKKGCVQVDFNDYDYVLEIHFNACVKDLAGNGKTTGTEIYVTKTDSTTEVEQCIVNGISKLGFKNRGVKKGNYAVINKAYKAAAESALLEVCFIDDADDMSIYANDRNRVAVNITESIVRAFNLKGEGVNKTQSETNTSVFKVKLLDNLNIRETPNGKIVIPDTNPKGARKGSVYTIVETSGNWGRLKSGAGWISISQKYVVRV